MTGTEQQLSGQVPPDAVAGIYSVEVSRAGVPTAVASQQVTIS